MKLIVLATLVAVAVGARLEHLERAYLPPDNGSQGSPGFQNPNFGQNPNGQTNGPSQSPSGSQTSGSQGASGGSATSNQYLPPDHGPSGSSNGFGNFAGSFRPVPGFNTQGSQYTPQFGSGNRPNQAAQSSNYQNPPQQAFDEETGYHY